MKAAGVHNTATGSFTGAGAIVTLTLGFVPAEVIVFNETDVITWHKLYDQAAANCRKVVAAGTNTLDTGSAIVINTDGTVTLSATLAANGKACKWIARV